MAQRIFTSLLVFVLFLFNVSGQSEHMVNIKFEENNTVPPSYTFKADFTGNAVRYLWQFSDNTLYEESSPVHTFKNSGSYGVTVKITDEPGNVYYGRTTGHFSGANNTATTPQYQRAKGWVKDLSSTDGCGLVIVTDGREVFLPVEILPKFRLEEGQQVEFAFEFLRNVGTICMAGKPIRIHRIGLVNEQPRIQAARGEVIDLSQVEGCKLVIRTENRGVLVPMEIVPDFELKEGQKVHFTFEVLTITGGPCIEGPLIKIHRIAEIPPPPQWQTARGKVVDLTEIADCRLGIQLNNSETLLPVEIVPEIVLSEGMLVAISYEYLDDHNTVCMAGKPVKVHRIKILKEDYPTDRCQVKLTYFPADRSNMAYRFLARSNAPVEKWEWNFGDGNSSNSPEPVYTYNAPGIYNVECTILTADGCEATGTITVIVKEILPVCPGGLTLTLFDPEPDQCNGEAHVTMFDRNGDEYENVHYLWSTGEEGNSILNLCPDIPYYIHAIVEGVCQKNTSFTFFSKPRWRVNRSDRTYTFEVINPVSGITYYWNFGDGNSAVGESASNNFEKSGEYNVNLTAVMGASSIDAEETISVETTLTGIDQSHISDFTIHPNPAKDIIYINSGSRVPENVSVIISDISGRQLMHQQAKQAGNALPAVNIQSLRPGIYFVQVISDNESQFVKKLIVTNR